MPYGDRLKPLLADCEDGEAGIGCPPDIVELHERQFGVRFSAQYRRLLLEVGWFRIAAGGLEVKIFGDGDDVIGPYTLIDFNNERFKDTEWVLFGEHDLWGRDPEGDYDVIYTDWFFFRRGGEVTLESPVYRFRMYSDWISDDMKDRDIPHEEWRLAYPDFDTWLSATIARLREAVQKQRERP